MTSNPSSVPTVLRRGLGVQVAATAAVSLAAGAAVLHDKTEVAVADAGTPSLAGGAAGMRFNDAEGNSRLPTPAERAALAEAFQADLARLTRGKQIPAGSRREPNGSVSAVVGAEKMRFLTVRVGEGGDATFGHASMDEEGRVEPAPANDWPEM